MMHMREHNRGHWLAGLAAVAIAFSLQAPELTLSAGPSQRAAQVFPGAEWGRVADPKAIGYCQDRLDLATARAKQLPTTGMVVIVGGRVLWEYGDLKRVSYLASVRKSILAMMYGNYVQSGRIKLDKTMADLKIDDVDGLLPAEKEATVLDLLGARSGVYHEAANAACTGCGSTAGDPPGPRGSVRHGTYFLYNNWDFNVLGTIFEQETGTNIYDAFERDLATPAGLQDFDRAAQRKSENRRASIHPAYHFYLSTRDMARVGYIMLRGGVWDGKQLVPRDWVHRIVTPVTRVGDMNPESYRKGPFGYGLLWWIWDGPFNEGPYKNGYSGIGAVGQFITVLPELDMVIAHKTEPQPGGASVSRPAYLSIVDAVIAARCTS
ncbi:MAG TPA: serine hydrolase [Vicinamibacterales bacterium]|jgi:CubicO group peptidase (beta-lactamase class C family)